MRLLFFSLLQCLAIFHLSGQNARDTLHIKGAFLSINFRGTGVDDNVRQVSYSYLVFLAEGGYWIENQTALGISGATSYLASNVHSKNYIPFEGNIWLKHFPLKRPFKWVGLQTQFGLANSCMDILDPRRPVFFQYSIGPAFMWTVGKKRKGSINYVLQLYDQLGASCPGHFTIAGENISLWQYLGLGYTFAK